MNIQHQLDEIELLQSMYSSPGEFLIEDEASYEQAVAFNRQLCVHPPKGLSYKLCVLTNTHRDSDEEEENAQSVATDTQRSLELAVRLGNSYPDTLPDVYLSSKDLHRTNQDQLNSDLQQYMSTLSLGEPCILTVVEWTRDNAPSYFPIPISHSTISDSDSQPSSSKYFSRMWLYMHHIYSKTKRRNILAYASDLDLTGFCLPGKPGVVCVEGTEQNTKEFYSILRRWNWKSITCRRRESIESLDIDSCRRITSFQELLLDVRGTHLNLGQFLDYLKRHKLEHMFKELFGVDGQS